MDLKRVGYLLLLSLMMGLGLVHLRTAQRQAVNRAVQLVQQEREIRYAIWEQQVQLSETTESPGWLKERILEAGVEVRPRGTEEPTAEDDDVLVAKRGG